MDESLRQIVRERAGERCEYCRLAQSVATAIRFHVEHICPRQHGGEDSPDNLALACPNCNWHKGPNLSAIDPATGAIASLFNPRHDAWSQHFALDGLTILGLTAIGRATVRLLRMNSRERLEIRRQLQLRGELEADG